MNVTIGMTHIHILLLLVLLENGHQVLQVLYPGKEASKGYERQLAWPGD